MIKCFVKSINSSKLVIFFNPDSCCVRIIRTINHGSVNMWIYFCREIRWDVASILTREVELQRQQNLEARLCLPKEGAGRKYNCDNILPNKEDLKKHRINLHNGRLNWTSNVCQHKCTWFKSKQWSTTSEVSEINITSAQWSTRSEVSEINITSDKLSTRGQDKEAT